MPGLDLDDFKDLIFIRKELKDVWKIDVGENLENLLSQAKRTFFQHEAELTQREEQRLDDEEGEDVEEIELHSMVDELMKEAQITFLVTQVHNHQMESFKEEVDSVCKNMRIDDKNEGRKKKKREKKKLHVDLNEDNCGSFEDLMKIVLSPNILVDPATEQEGIDKGNNPKMRNEFMDVFTDNDKKENQLRKEQYLAERDFNLAGMKENAKIENYIPLYILHRRNVCGDVSDYKLCADTIPTMGFYEREEPERDIIWDGCIDMDETLLRDRPTDKTYMDFLDDDLPNIRRNIAEGFPDMPIMQPTLLAPQSELPGPDCNQQTKLGENIMSQNIIPEIQAVEMKYEVKDGDLPEFVAAMKSNTQLIPKKSEETDEFTKIQNKLISNLNHGHFTDGDDERCYDLLVPNPSRKPIARNVPYKRKKASKTYALRMAERNTLLPYFMFKNENNIKSKAAYRPGLLFNFLPPNSEEFEQRREKLAETLQDTVDLKIKRMKAARAGNKTVIPDLPPTPMSQRDMFEMDPNDYSHDFDDSPEDVGVASPVMVDFPKHEEDPMISEAGFERKETLIAPPKLDEFKYFDPFTSMRGLDEYDQWNKVAELYLDDDQPLKSFNVKDKGENFIEQMRQEVERTNKNELLLTDLVKAPEQTDKSLRAVAIAQEIFNADNLNVNFNNVDTSGFLSLDSGISITLLQKESS